MYLMFKAERSEGEGDYCKHHNVGIEVKNIAILIRIYSGADDMFSNSVHLCSDWNGTPCHQKATITKRSR
jgi:hypothetical protein